VPIEPAKRIPLVPIVRRDDSASLSQKKKTKQQKKEEKRESGKIDIKV